MISFIKNNSDHTKRKIFIISDENLGNWDSDGQRDQRIRGTCCRVTAPVTPRGRWLGHCCRVTLLTFVLCINFVGLRDKGKCCWNKKPCKKYLNQQHTQTHLGNGGIQRNNRKRQRVDGERIPRYCPGYHIQSLPEGIRRVEV